MNSNIEQYSSKGIKCILDIDFTDERDQFYIEAYTYNKADVLERIGTALFFVEPKTNKVVVSNLSVKQAYRRNGVGSLLLGYAEAVCKNQNVASVTGFCANDPSDDGVRKFYKSNGYRVMMGRFFKTKDKINFNEIPALTTLMEKPEESEA